MEQEGSARERIMAAFIKKLETSSVSADEAATLTRIAGVMDAHFTRYCSFYDREKTMETLLSAPSYYSTFLSRLADYERMNVSELAQAAGVNRTTFYKFFPNVTALYDACCEDLIDRFLSVPLPEKKTVETMSQYGLSIWQLMQEKSGLMFTLSHRINKKQLPYIVGTRLKEQMAASLTDAERVSLRVKENVSLFPDLFSVLFSLLQVEALVPGVYPDRGLPAYRRDRSLIENIADLFVSQYGGSFDFYYALGGAALKLLAEKRFDRISVSELCKTAGYPRSSFYACFTDHTDYVMKVCENAVITCLSAFLYFLEHQDELTPQTLTVFRGELVDFKIEGLRAIFLNGSITYIFSALYTYLLRIFIAREEKKRGEKVDYGFKSRLSYYIVYAMRLFSMNYLGDMTDAELFTKTKELARIKSKLWKV